MERYWLYLEPYVFVFEGRQGAIIYNTLSASVVSVNSDIVLPFVHDLNLAENGYCIEVSEEQVQEESMAFFIKELRDKFSGDLVPVMGTGKKPFILKPIMNLVYDPDKFEKDLGKSLDENLLHYLHEVTLYLDSECKNDCLYCQQFYKQFTFCTKRGHREKLVLSIDDYSKLIELLKLIGLHTINLVVNDFSKYSLFWCIIDLLSNSDFKVNVFTHYLNLNDEVLAWNVKQKMVHFILLADAEISEEIVFDISSCFSSALWKFPVLSSEDCLRVNQLKEKYVIDVELVPFFNGDNDDFFSENVYTDVEDLFTIPLSKREIFARQALNVNLFGKLFVMSDGEVYSNMVSSSLGNLKEDSLNGLIFKEFSTKNSWLLKRDKEPCSDCVYRYLCPSPSNYELVMGRFNLCNIK